MVRIIWTDLAKTELEEIYHFIAQDSKIYAKRQVLKIRNRTKILRKSKYIGKIISEIGIPIFRELIEGNYRIIYKINRENEVLILTIHHSSRDLENRKIE
jgi:plasmid stabilization system protein ParE